MPAVRQQVQAFIDANLSPKAQSAALAGIARRGVAELVRSGKAPPSYQVVVDGRYNVAEDAVRPNGTILYLFDSQASAAVFAISYLRGRAPKRSGRYVESIWIGVNGAFTRASAFDPASVPAGATIELVDTAPYARKVEVGHMTMSVPHKVVEDASRAARRKFPLVNVDFGYVEASSDIGGGYVLKGRFRKGGRANSRKSVRSDTRKGSAMTYPSFTITRK